MRVYKLLLRQAGASAHAHHDRLNPTVLYMVYSDQPLRALYLAGASTIDHVAGGGTRDDRRGTAREQNAGAKDASKSRPSGTRQERRQTSAMMTSKSRQAAPTNTAADAAFEETPETTEANDKKVSGQDRAERNSATAEGRDATMKHRSGQ